jgi:UDP-2-acetamido-3-amino-2,3-dideoxy-glucuronate N-acetyltransferase
MILDVQAMGYFVHKSAIIDAGAVIGEGTKIWHWVHICSSAQLGRNCIIGQNVFIGATTIGSNVKIQNNVSVYDGVTIEDDVFCGPSMVFTNVINPRSHIVRRHEFRKTLVRRGATIGANAVIVCGHTIGSYAMVGAGAVVTRDVADFALMVGNPARRMGWVCQCGVRLKPFDGQAHCESCGWDYEVSTDACRPLRNATAAAV